MLQDLSMFLRSSQSQIDEACNYEEVKNQCAYNYNLTKHKKMLFFDNKQVHDNMKRKQYL